MDTSRLARAAVAAALLAGSMSGCAAGVQGCASWADVSDPQVASDAADAVIIGEVREAMGSARLFGTEAAVHRLTVTSVVKGEVAAGDELRVIATPVTCTGDESYPEGDPLDITGERMFLLTQTENGRAAEAASWRLLSPFDSVIDTASGEATLTP